MAEFTVDEILEATGGKLLAGKPGARASGVGTDSRNIQPGEVFFALRGEKYDGHDFTAQAAAGGAGVLVVEEKPEIAFPPGVAVVQVADTLEALGKLAAWHRQRFSIPVIGVTGSNGKTTTKELLAALLAQRYRVVKNAMNYNNEIGLPLTLLTVDSDTEVIILEMGMRGEGQIAYLARIARPTAGVITNVGHSHLELLGSQEAIARAKGELIAALPRKGLAVLNGDDPRVHTMNRLFPGVSLFYGLEADGLDLRGTARPVTGGQEVTVTGRWGDFTFFLPLPGRHNTANALAATTVALSFGLTSREIATGMQNLPPLEKRLRVMEKCGLTIIDDTYNASPQSVQNALEVLDGMEGKRKIAILGDMLELGEFSAGAHRKIGEILGDYGCSALFAYGPKSAETAAAAAAAGVFSRHYPEQEALIRDLQAYVAKGDILLVKGSRGMKMEKVIKELLEQLVCARARESFREEEKR
ncbi:MAG TPA: UDP-N-acetylmuramoyl-tripeptide--D-alanyl-D-alanine ligase [Firmicutes bacterium]|jgi:UDP-N-acetylmuramoyl-tripeptide--D-alanyl-D-alanine ligase|nr:UDP-N-acetylmuramoyl-tripeptide--D-alanyl-D-alanine ligase [Bacillota bacterium]